MKSKLPNRVKFTRTDGRRLAVDMLRQFEAVHAEQVRIKARGRCHVDVVGPYLKQLRDSGSAALEAGFLNVLNDYLGACVVGVIPDPDNYSPRVASVAKS